MSILPREQYATRNEVHDLDFSLGQGYGYG